ncbi:MAG: TolC family protein [Bacteriovorax sp.]|nr:TolC family protein [Bacteriovorax sp.]
MLKASVCLLFILSTQSAFADSVKLNYADVERIFSTQNKEIKIAHINQEQSDHDVYSSYSGFLPVLTFANDYTDTHASNESSAKKIFSNSIGVTQNIFSGFQDYLKVKNAKLSLEEAGNNLSKERLTQISELKIAFGNLILSQRLIKFSKDLIVTRQGIKDLVALRFSSGSETKDSFLFADTQLEEANLSLITSKHSLESAKRKLRSIVGGELPEDFEVTGLIPLSDVPFNPDFQKIAVSSTEFQNAVLSEKIGAQEVQISQGKFLPTVDFSVSRERENKRAYSEIDYNKNYYTKYSINISFPIFEGFTSFHSLKKSELENDKNKINVIKTYEDQSMQLKDTFEKCIELKAKKEIYLKYLEAAKLREMINTSKYRLGIITFTTWIDAQNDLISYEKSVIEIDFEIETNLSKWEILAFAKN